jgi:antitoxin (DNA-binding transcriptional repressor) of toxin-antitoxin stability system
MADVSIRELRNEGGSVVERVLRGEHVTVTKGGVPVAEMRGISRGPVHVEPLLQRWRSVPRVDFGALRADLDDLLDVDL